MMKSIASSRPSTSRSKKWHSGIANQNIADVQTLEKNITDRITRQKYNVVETVEDRIQKTISATVNNICTPIVELAVRSVNASAGRDVVSVMANSDHAERPGVTSSFENASEKIY